MKPEQISQTKVWRINDCRLVIAGTDIILPDETADEHNITHWMPMPSVEHLKKGGEE